MRRFLLIILVLLIIAGGVWYFVIRPKQIANPTGQPTSSFHSFFPLGNNNTSTPNDQLVSGTVTPETPSVVQQAPSPFTQISASPIAGFAVFTLTKSVTVPSIDPKKKPTQQTVVEHDIRYVSRTNGYVYEIKDGGIPTQISNVYIPNIYEAFFAEDNKTVLLRFLRDDDQTIATYSVPIPDPNPDGTRTQKSGTYLQDGIKSIALSVDKKSLVRLTDGNGVSIVSTSDLRGGNIKQLMQSPFHDWLPLLTTKNTYLQTKATASINGFLYRIDTLNKRLVRVLGDIRGLTTSISPSIAFVLYSQSTDNSFSTKLFTTKNNSVRDLKLSILPEKCVWLKNEDLLCAGNDSVSSGTYPDAWYAGLTTFSDKFYRIYASVGAYDVVYGGNDRSFDATNLATDEDRRLLYFIDKPTGQLWQFSY